VQWRVRAIRGATTVTANTKEAMREAVHELLDELETHNQLDFSEIVSVTFSVTQDLDAVFPAAIARDRPHWELVPLIDVQQMYVKGSLERCIRLLIHFNTPTPSLRIYHPYLRDARHLRPDLALPR
jgi:chorismate mutase